MLTDGVLIMQHTDDEGGVLLMNPGLKRIFKLKGGGLTDGASSIGGGTFSDIAFPQGSTGGAG